MSVLMLLVLAWLSGLALLVLACTVVIARETRVLNRKHRDRAEIDQLERMFALGAREPQR